MASICKLPTETLVNITEYLDELQDVSSFSRIGKHFIHSVVVTELYKRVKNEVGVFCWACDQGRLGTVQRLLAAGADPNQPWTQDMPRSPAADYAYRWKIPVSSRWDLVTQDRRRPAANNPDEAALEEYQASLEAQYDEADDLDSLRDIDGIPSDTESDQDVDSQETRVPIDWDAHMVDSWRCPDLLTRQYDCDRSWSFHGTGRSHAWTPLHIAARWGHNKIVKLLLDQGADIEFLASGYCNCLVPTHWTRREEHTMFHDYRSDTFWSPLHTAICHEQESTAKLLLSRGASLNLVGRAPLRGSDIQPRMVTPLHAACASGATSLAAFLVDHLQIDVETKDHLGHTPMSYAYFTGMWECIDFLVERGATLNVKIGALTLVTHACKEERFEEALRLIQLGADTQQRLSILQGSLWSEVVMHSALICCASRRKRRDRAFTNVDVALRCKRQKYLRVEVVKELLKPEHRGRRFEFECRMALLAASSNLFPDVVRVLLGACAHTHKVWQCAFGLALGSPNPSGKGDLPKTVALLLPHLDGVLTEDAITSSIETVLGGAKQRYKDEIAVVKLLLDLTRGISLSSRMTERIWRHTMSNFSTKLRKILLEGGLEPPTQADLSSLIREAIVADSVVALEYLGSLSTASGSPWTGRHLFDAIHYKHKRCASFLITNGAPVNDLHLDGDTCLSQACRWEDPGVAHMLLDWGADPNIHGGELDKNPLSQAACNNLGLVGALLDHGANVHSPKPGTYASPLRFALYEGLTDSVALMIRSESFQNAPQEQRDEYLLTALSVPFRSWHGGSQLEYLLGRGGCDPNVIRDGFPPLADLLRSTRPNAIEILKNAGAKIHKRVNQFASPLRIVEPTVLSLAIRDANARTLEKLLHQETLSLENTGGRADGSADPDRLTPQLAADYVREACDRQEPEIIVLLEKKGLDFRIRDLRNGDTAVHMLCRGLGAYVNTLEDPATALLYHAACAALCLHYIACEVRYYPAGDDPARALEPSRRGVDPTLRNRRGVSGCERVRRVVDYQGSNPHWRTVAAVWGVLLEVDGESIKRRPDGRERFAQVFGETSWSLQEIENEFVPE